MPQAPVGNTSNFEMIAGDTINMIACPKANSRISCSMLI